MGLAFLVHLGHGRIRVEAGETPSDVTIIRHDWQVKGHPGWGCWQIGHGVRVHEEGELPIGTIFAYRPGIGDERDKAEKIIAEASELSGRLVTA